jgi:hypothetical protein
VNVTKTRALNNYVMMTIKDDDLRSLGDEMMFLLTFYCFHFVCVIVVDWYWNANR